MSSQKKFKRYRLFRISLFLLQWLCVIVAICVFFDSGLKILPQIILSVAFLWLSFKCHKLSHLQNVELVKEYQAAKAKKLPLNRRQRRKLKRFQKKNG